jgi:hypothetical protein
LDILGKVTSNNAESQNAAYSINRSFDGAYTTLALALALSTFNPSPLFIFPLCLPLHLSYLPTFAPTLAPSFVPIVGPMHLPTGLRFSFLPVPFASVLLGRDTGPNMV